MQEIAITTIVMVYSLLTVISFPLGFSVIKSCRPNWIKLENIVPLGFLATALGFSISPVIWWVIAHVSFTSLEFVMAPLAVAVLFLVIHYYNRKPTIGTSLEEIGQSLSQLKSRQNIFFLILGGISFAHFIWINSYLSWSQAGDSWWLSRYVMAILNQSKYPTTLAPYDTEPLAYPLGFLLPVAGICSSFDIVPGISILTVASFIFAFITLIPPYFTYQKTKSLTYSLLAFALCFYLHPSNWAQNCIYYNFLNGTVPSMLGILQAFMVFAIIPFTIDRNNHWSRHFIVLALLASSIFITYPSFMVIPGIAFFIFMLSYVSANGVIGKRKDWLTILIISVLGIILIFVLWPLIQEHFALIFERIEEVLNNDYGIRSNYFTESLFLPITIIAILGALLARRDSDYKSIAVSFVVLMLLAVLSLNESLYSFGLGLLLPNRLMLFLQLWSFSFLFIAVDHVRKKIGGNGPLEISFKYGSRLLKVKTPPIRSLVSMSCTVFLLLIIMIPVTVSVFEVVRRTDYAWYTRNESFQRDMRGANYIRENYGEDRLVLNYQTWSDWALPSAGLPNVVYTNPISDANLKRALALKAVWEHPENESLVWELVNLYTVEIVYVSSFWAVLPLIDDWNLTTTVRPVPAGVCIETFLSYDFLELVYREDDCAVFATHIV